MLTPGELKVLKKIGECHVINKQELVKNMDTETAAIEAVVKSLLQKNCITTVSPVGSKCFIITKDGLQALSHRE